MSRVILLAGLLLLGGCTASSEGLVGGPGDAAAADEDAGSLGDAGGPLEDGGEHDASTSGAGDGGASRDGGHDGGTSVDGGHDGGTVRDAGAGDSGCSGTTTLADVQSNVFVGCQGVGPRSCHGGTAGLGGLDLSPGHSYSSLHATRSTMSADPRVTPGNLQHSFLWRKLTNHLATDGSEGGPMPQGEGIRWQMLPDAKLEAVRCWILQGAAND